MKRVTIAMLILAGAVSFSFADEGEKASTPPAAEETAKTVVKEVSLRTGTSDFVTGKVVNVTPADLLTRPKSKISVVDDSGNSTEFIVKALAVVYDSTGRFLDLDDVRPDQKVQISYITKAGKAREAVSIKILE